MSNDAMGPPVLLLGVFGCWWLGLPSKDVLESGLHGHIQFHTEAGQCVAYDVFCTYFEYVKKSNYLPTHTADHGCNMFQHTASNIFCPSCVGTSIRLVIHELRKVSDIP